MIPAFMTRQLARTQQDLLDRLLSDDLFAREMAKHPSHARLSEWLLARPTKKVLELGCGPGKYVAMLSSLGFEVVGVDPCDFPSWKTIREHSSADLTSGVFAEDLPFPDQYFDHAVCLGALLYFESPQKALQELKRVLKPGARIVLRTVNSGNRYTKRTGKRLDPASKTLLTMEELVSLILSAGFRVHDSYSYGYWPSALTNFWWYLECTSIPLCVQDWLSDRTPPAERVNNVVFLSVD